MSGQGKGYHFSVRVYFEDTDFSGNVYHAAYLKFFERARTEFLRERGVHHSELARDGLAFAVREMHIFYDRAAYIDDVLEVETTVSEARGARFTLAQHMTREGEMVCRAHVVAVLLDKRGRPMRLPASLRAQIATA